MMHDPVAAVDSAIAAKVAEHRRLIARADAHAAAHDDREWPCRQLAARAWAEIDPLLDNRLRLMVIYRADYVASQHSA